MSTDLEKSLMSKIKILTPDQLLCNAYLVDPAIHDLVDKYNINDYVTMDQCAEIISQTNPADLCDVDLFVGINTIIANRYALNDNESYTGKNLLNYRKIESPHDYMSADDLRRIIEHNPSDLVITARDDSGNEYEVSGLTIENMEMRLHLHPRR